MTIQPVIRKVSILGTLMAILFSTHVTIAGNGVSCHSMTHNTSNSPENSGRDKSGTREGFAAHAKPQTLYRYDVADFKNFQAEGTRFELATGFPARHFQCRR